MAGCVGFYPHRIGCYLYGERMLPQAGGFCGGWVTDDIDDFFRVNHGCGPARPAAG